MPDAFRNSENDPVQLDVLTPAAVCVAGSFQSGGGTSSVAVDQKVYKSRLTRTKPRRKLQPRTITVEHALGSMTFNASRLTQFAVPAGLAPGGEDANLPDGGASSLTCYTATYKRRDPGSTFRRQTVALTDPWIGPQTYEIGNPVRLCLTTGPLPTTPEPIPSSSDFLVCHRAKVAKKIWPNELVSTNSRFGVEVLEVTNLLEVCLPAVHVSVGSSAADPPFAFLTTPGTTNEAMAGLWRRGFQAPQDEEAATVALLADDAARAVIRDHLVEARASLLTALAQLSPDDEGEYNSLGGLLRVAGDTPPILDHLLELVLRVVPEEDGKSESVEPSKVVQHFALGMIMEHAANGSAAARERILQAVQSPTESVQTTAIGNYYELSTDRRLAQRQMRALLEPSQRYLVYGE